MRLIDADKLLKTPLRIVGEIGGKYHCETIPVKVIDKAPTINPEDLQPHGHWIEYPTGGLVCSHCHRYKPDEWRSMCCPNCGARMREEARP